MDWYGTDAMPISLVAAYAMFLLIVGAAWLRDSSSKRRARKETETSDTAVQQN